MKIDVTIKIQSASPADVEKVKKALEALKDQPNADKESPSK